MVQLSEVDSQKYKSLVAFLKSNSEPLAIDYKQPISVEYLNT